MRLEGKVAVITGAGSGMGRAMANLFAAEGAKIVAAEWNEATLAEVVDEVKAAGGEIVGVQGNVADKADCEKIIDEAVAAFGKVDVLCNNAGVMDVNQGAAETDDAMWERVIGINTERAVLSHAQGDPGHEGRQRRLDHQHRVGGGRGRRRRRLCVHRLEARRHRPHQEHRVPLWPGRYPLQRDRCGRG